MTHGKAADHSPVIDEASQVEFYMRMYGTTGWADTNRHRVRPVEIWYVVYERAAFAVFPDGRCIELGPNMQQGEMYNAILNSQSVVSAVVPKIKTCMAVELFVRTRSLHNLGPDHRLMLEVAALLHEIGTFVNSSDHHKHTQYILQVSPLVGLDDDQTSIVSNVARYHRKSLPKPQHDAYRLLSSKNRVAVSKLAALLRLADAMDNEHGSKVGTLDRDIRGGRVALRLKGEGDLLLEKWALAKKAPMFEEVFSVKFTVEE